MPVVVLNKNPEKYTCMSYYIWSGERSKPQGVLIDTGSDSYIIKELRKYSISNNVPPVSKIILTHSHFDHAGGVRDIKELWNPEVLAYSKNEDVDTKVTDGMNIYLGYEKITLYHTPGHTVDSIAIYLNKEKALFTGDTPIKIRSTIGTYHKTFPIILKLFLNLELKGIYPGHDYPITENIYDILNRSYTNVKNSKIFS